MIAKRMFVASVSQDLMEISSCASTVEVLGKQSLAISFLVSKRTSNMQAFKLL